MYIHYRWCNASASCQDYGGSGIGGSSRGQETATQSRGGPRYYGRQGKKFSKIGWLLNLPCKMAKDLTFEK